MVYQRRFFEKNQPVHIVSRALADIFKDAKDCYRFIFQFYVANIGKRGFNVRVEDAVKAGQALLKGENIPSKFVAKEHSPLVDLIDFSLVVNHYHLNLLARVEKAIPLLIGRLNNGFAKSFNLIHKRKDAVFGSRYKGIPARTDFQFAAVVRYVTIINPLDVFQPGWREVGLRNWKEALEFLENYEFSSFPDKIGKRKSVMLAPEEIQERYTAKTEFNEYRRFVEDFLKQKLASFNKLFLE